MTWSEPTKWILPKGESFYGKKVKIFEHTILEYNYVVPHLNSKRVVLDIGAHIGSTTVRYAKDFDEVKSFEPIYFSELTLNTEHLDNVTLYENALSDYTGVAEMYKARSNSGMTRMATDESIDYVTNKRSAWFDQKPITVNTLTLDSYNFQEVDFIKIDTENYVLPILTGGMDTLRNNNPILQIECTENIDAVDKFLNNLGYKLYDTFSVERFYKK